MSAAPSTPTRSPKRLFGSGSGGSSPGSKILPKFLRKAQAAPPLDQSPRSPLDERQTEGGRKNSSSSSKVSAAGKFPIFTITYSKNDDGDIQEFKAAESCVQSIFPDSIVVPKEVQRIPFRVIVVGELEDGTHYRIWQGRQQNLTRSHGNVPTRTLTMREMTTQLETFRNEIMDETN